MNIDQTPFDEQREYDTVVVGSDEVWNLTSSNFTHYPQYFGKRLRARRLLSYAASGNSTAPSDVRGANLDFSAFNALSVRDEKTRSLVETVDGRHPQLVCDPTLLISGFDDVLRDVHESGYILVYSYGMDRQQIAQIRAFARQKQKKLFSVGTYNNWCDRNIVADPFAFLSWLKGADQVITSTFHGAILSVKLQKEFAVYTHSGDHPGNHKIQDFLHRVGLEDRDAADASLNEIFSRKIDYASVNDTVELLRTRSKDFLMEAMGLND